MKSPAPCKATLRRLRMINLMENDVMEINLSTLYKQRQAAFAGLPERNAREII